MRNVKKKLLEVLSPDELERQIEEKMNQGARNERSAMNKILRENREQPMEETDLMGYFIKTYIRQRDDQMHMALINPSGIKRVAIEKDVQGIDRWEPVEVSDVVTKKNIMTNSTWLEETDGTVVQSIADKGLDYRLEDVLQTPGDISGGDMYCLQGFVQYTNRIPTDFDDNNNPVGYEPVIDGEDVNLKLTISDGNDQCTVKVEDIETLKELTQTDDIMWVNNNIEELQDMLANMNVVVFGSGNDRVAGDRVRPFVQLRNYGFIEWWA